MGVVSAFNPSVALTRELFFPRFSTQQVLGDALDLGDIFEVTKKSVCGANSLKSNIHRRNPPIGFSGWGSLPMQSSSGIFLEPADTLERHRASYDIDYCLVLGS